MVLVVALITWYHYAHEKVGTLTVAVVSHGATTGGGNATGTSSGAKDASGGAAAASSSSSSTAGANSGGMQGSDNAGVAAGQQSSEAVRVTPAAASQKPVLFYDIGHVYHHLPSCPEGWQRPGVGCDASPCPVAWEWTGDKKKADAGESRPTNLAQPGPRPWPQSLAPEPGPAPCHATRCLLLP